MTIEERIERLERQNRHLRLGLAGIVLGAAAIFAGAAARKAVPDVIKARAFQVVADDGTPLVVLGAPTGIGAVATFNGRGQELVRLAATTDGNGTVTTHSSKGQMLVRLGVSTVGAGTVTTSNGKGQELVKLGVFTEGTGFVAVLDPSGRKRRGVLTTQP